MNSPFKNGRLTEAMSTLAFHLLTICDEKAEKERKFWEPISIYILNEIINIGSTTVCRAHFGKAVSNYCSQSKLFFLKMKEIK